MLSVLSSNTLVTLKKEYILFKGPLGLSYIKLGGLDIQYQNNSLLLKSKRNYLSFLSLVLSKTSGLSSGYYVHLVFKGLGYRFIHLKNKLLIRLGYTHYLEYTIPSTISVIGFKTNLYLFSLDYNQVMRISRFIKSLSKFNKYIEKGIFDFGEVVKLKVGKER